MANFEIYQSRFLIRIPEDHPNYAARVQQILEIIRPFKLVGLEVFWPVGLPILPKPEREFEVRKKWDLGKLSAAFQKKARGKLVAEFSSQYQASEALEALSATEDNTLGSKTPPPPRRRPNVVTKPGHEKISGREVPPAIVSEAAADPLWAKTLLKPPDDWLNYTLRNIAVIDSGCDTSHPTFLGYGKTANKSRVTSFGGTQDYGGHGSFVCGQLVGKGGVADLPTM